MHNDQRVFNCFSGTWIDVSRAESDALLTCVMLLMCCALFYIAGRRYVRFRSDLLQRWCIW